MRRHHRPRARTELPPPQGTVFFNDRTEHEWVLRGGQPTRIAIARIVADIRTPAPPPRARHRSELGIPRHTEEPPRRVLSAASGPAPRHLDRRSHLRRRRPRPEPRSDGIVRPGQPHAFYDTEVDHHWRLPIGKTLRRADIVSDPRPTRWRHGPASEGDARARGAFQVDRTDRRDIPAVWGRGRTARWRGLLARKDLVDGAGEALQNCSENGDELSPRSSFDIEEANSLYSWDEPPSTSVRGWRSNHSLSFRPKKNERPRHIRLIGRQKCINDLTNIVDASCEPCVSYDRQIFDPVSKLWTYVEASQPSSSPWELPSQPSSSPWDMRAVGSPVTCSVSGTEEPLSGGARSRALAMKTDAAAQRGKPAEAAAFRRKPSVEDTERAFMASRDQWLGYSRKSVYGPANLEAVIFASEIDEEVEESGRRRETGR